MTAGPASAIIRLLYPVSRAGVRHATPNLPDTGCDRCRRGLRSVTPSAQTLPLRICVFGPEIDEAWLRGVAGSLPARAFLALFGAAADTPLGDTGVARHAQGDAVDPASVLRHAVAAYPGEDLVLLRTGTVLPAFWCERLLRAIGEADVLVASRSRQRRCDPVTTARRLAQRCDATGDRRLVLCARPSSADRLADDLPAAQRLVRDAFEHRVTRSGCAAMSCRRCLRR